VLNRGGVISGSSAGASILGSFLARGDTSNNTIVIGDHTVGFGYLKNSAIDQHVLVRNRHFDMTEIIDARPELLGLAIDEDTALVVHQNEMEVIGSTYALIHDKGFWSREGEWERKLPRSNARFYFLKKEDRYDLAARKVIAPEGSGGQDYDYDW
jgi:cyanophycinase-like exopeptidase